MDHEENHSRGNLCISPPKLLLQIFTSRP